MKYGLIGEKLGHSFSKEIHSRLAGYEYELKEIPKENLGGFFAEKKFSGINVTIPYKESVMKYLDFISDEAKSIGAVNTVVNSGGKLYGYNTDFFGLKSLIKRAEIEVCGKNVFILGFGGTSRTAKAVCESLGAKSIVKVARTARYGAITYAEFYEMANDVNIIINTTPVGTFPNIFDIAADLTNFSKLSGVIDVVYNPLRTKLVQTAKDLSVKADGGLYMLVSQAVKASEIFTGVEYSKDTSDRVFEEIKTAKENIVLTGMPSSGKSTVGKILAEKLGRDFIDTDDIVVKRTGKKISDLIVEKGEIAFRKIETECVKEISVFSGKVIATGGGVILDSENVSALKQNGKIFFIDRPLDKLIPTYDRPLSSTLEDIKRLYVARRATYISTADERIAADCDAFTVADKILRSIG